MNIRWKTLAPLLLLAVIFVSFASVLASIILAQGVRLSEGIDRTGKAMSLSIRVSQIEKEQVADILRFYADGSKASLENLADQDEEIARLLSEMWTLSEDPRNADLVESYTRSRAVLARQRDEFLSTTSTVRERAFRGWSVIQRETNASLHDIINYGRIHIDLSLREALFSSKLLGALVVTSILLSLAMVAIAALYYRKIIVRPLQLLSAQTRAIASGDFNADAAVRDESEMGQLAAALSVMSRRLRNYYDDLRKEVDAKTAELKRANLFLDSIIDNIPNMVFVKDADELRFVRFNKAGLELMGVRPEQVIGKNDYDFFPKDQADFFVEKDRKTLGDKAVVDIPEEKFDSNANKGLRYLHTKKVPILDEKGVPRYLLGISEDITDRKAVEESLRRTLEELKVETVNARRFQLAVESSTDGILIAEGDTRILYVNPAWEELTGYRLSEVRGLKPNILHSDKTPVEVRDAMRNAVHHALSYHSDDVINRRKDGSEYNVDLTIYPVHMADKTYFVGIHTDITARKRADAAKSDFIALASHQLRTPLTAIRLALSEIARGNESIDREEEKRLVARAHEYAVRMAETIRTMLNIARLEQGKLVPEVASVPIAELLRKAMREYDPEIVAKGHRVSVDCAPDVTCETDGSLLGEVIANLIGNAVAYTPDGGTIAVSAARGADGITIKVVDSGCGIPAADQKKIFTKFFRASNAPAIKVDGTGLGLFLSAGIVRLLGGTISFQSGGERGTVFSVTLPANYDSSRRES